MNRILVGFIMDGKSGGVDTYLMNFLQTIESIDVSVDFLTNEVNAQLKEKLLKQHARLLPVSNLWNPVAQYKQVCNYIKKNKYDMVYLNISTAIDCVAAIAAKNCKVKRICIHSHSSGNDCESTAKRIVYNTIHYICRLFLYRYATEYVACSKKAGLWLFPKRIVQSSQFRVVYNAVSRDKFQFDEAIRAEVRAELGGIDKYIIGHAGNFCYQKNHVFFISMMEELLKMEPNALLLLVGKGPRLDMLKQMVKQAGLKEHVRFLGFRSDVNRLMQAMDIFVLPSNFEGLPIVGIEAQYAGLTCILSDKITTEARITDRCRFLPINRGSEVQWAEAIIESKGKDRKNVSVFPEEKHYHLEAQKAQFIELIERGSK